MPRRSDRTIFMHLYEQELQLEGLFSVDDIDDDLEIDDLDLDEFSDSETSSSSSISSLSSFSSLSSLSSHPSISSSSLSSSSMASNSDDYISGSSNHQEYTYIETLEDLLPLVQSQRYLLEREVKPKSRHFINNILPQLDDYDFKEQFLDI